jgi:hypothetical protein
MFFSYFFRKNRSQEEISTSEMPSQKKRKVAEGLCLGNKKSKFFLYFSQLALPLTQKAKIGFILTIKISKLILYSIRLALPLLKKNVQ